MTLDIYSRILPTLQEGSMLRLQALFIFSYIQFLDIFAATHLYDECSSLRGRGNS